MRTTMTGHQEVAGDPRRPAGEAVVGHPDPTLLVGAAVPGCRGGAARRRRRRRPPRRNARGPLVGTLIGILVIANNVGNLFMTTLARDHPAVLLSLNSSNRMLGLTTNQLDPWSYYGIGSAPAARRRPPVLPARPLVRRRGHPVGRAQVGQPGRGAPDVRAGLPEGGLRASSSWPPTTWCASWPAPGRCRSPASSRPTSPAPPTRLFLIRRAGEALSSPLDAVLDVFERYRWPLLAISFVVVAASFLSDRRRGADELHAVEELEDLEDEIEEHEDPDGGRGTDPRGWSTQHGLAALYGGAWTHGPGSTPLRTRRGAAAADPRRGPRRLHDDRLRRGDRRPDRHRRERRPAGGLRDRRRQGGAPARRRRGDVRRAGGAFDERFAHPEQVEQPLSEVVRDDLAWFVAWIGPIRRSSASPGSARRLAAHGPDPAAHARSADRGPAHRAAHRGGRGDGAWSGARAPASSRCW